VSLVIHAALALPYFLRTETVPERHDPLDQMVVFLVPPSETVGRQNQGSGIDWSGLDGNHGATPTPIKPRAEVPEETIALGQAGEPDTVSQDPGPAAEPETALTEIEVDSAVVRDPSSAAPIYPEDLLHKSIEGATFVHYVVDTTGMVDTSTIQVVRTTHPGFALAVREALGKMRFRPAVQASRKVRQWVEQNFAFRITPPKTVAADTT
jgi:TonB family protein